MNKTCTIETKIGTLNISLFCQSFGRQKIDITLFPVDDSYPGITFGYSYSKKLLLSTEWESALINSAEIEELSRITNRALKWQEYWN